MVTAPIAHLDTENVMLSQVSRTRSAVFGMSTLARDLLRLATSERKKSATNVTVKTASAIEKKLPATPSTPDTVSGISAAALSAPDWTVSPASVSPAGEKMPSSRRFPTSSGDDWTYSTSERTSGVTMMSASSVTATRAPSTTIVPAIPRPSRVWRMRSWVGASATRPRKIPRKTSRSASATVASATARPTAARP